MILFFFNTLENKLNAMKKSNKFCSIKIGIKLKFVIILNSKKKQIKMQLIDVMKK